MERMGGVGDLDLIRKGQVAFSDRGISLCCRADSRAVRPRSSPHHRPATARSRRTPFSLPSAVRAGRISLASAVRSAPACPGGGTARRVGDRSGRGPTGATARAAALDVRRRGLRRDGAQGPPRVALEALLSLAGVLDEMSGGRVERGSSCGRSSIRGGRRCPERPPPPPQLRLSFESDATGRQRRRRRRRCSRRSPSCCWRRWAGPRWRRAAGRPAMSAKIAADHLARGAVVYVRQSTMTQVLGNLESQKRQYALADAARAAGFASVTVIDDDLGRSGSGLAARPGFQRLVAEVCAGAVGAVFCLEASRLARNGRDWHHLVDLCALTGALVIDPDGVYDPRLMNDRLLLGLKGTMSEYELSLLRQRGLAARDSKAGRGALRFTLPPGLVWSEDGRIELDPDERVQGCHPARVREVPRARQRAAGLPVGPRRRPAAARRPAQRHRPPDRVARAGLPQRRAGAAQPALRRRLRVRPPRRADAHRRRPRREDHRPQQGRWPSGTSSSATTTRATSTGSGSRRTSGCCSRTPT